jgi:hypothetical protein
LRSNRIFPFTNTIFISVKIGIATSIFPEFVSLRVLIMGTLCSSSFVSLNN